MHPVIWYGFYSTVQELDVFVAVQREDAKPRGAEEGCRWFRSGMSRCQLRIIAGNSLTGMPPDERHHVSSMRRGPPTWVQRVTPPVTGLQQSNVVANLSITCLKYPRR